MVTVFTDDERYKTLLVMERVADVYVYPTIGCKLWDTCAPHALLSALGGTSPKLQMGSNSPFILGTMTTPSGAKIQYSSKVDVNLTKGIVASLANHDVYIKKLMGIDADKSI
jgi:3'-phosphoadenosine 5'-phosphosulfate (PAPS) 3'-phosphatase